MTRSAEQESTDKEFLTFTVDSALLVELGERLVGRPAVALAELIKNSYDADATVVDVTVEPGTPGRLEVRDNGHGMTYKEFSGFWMRVGSTHKSGQESRTYHRPMTGSKGVGRIATMVLASEISISTVAASARKKRLVARLNWNKATKAGELTSAKVEYEIEELAQAVEPGTSVVMVGLKQDWPPDEISRLAKEIWRLRPPFRGGPTTDGASASEADKAFAFDINFHSPAKDLRDIFRKQFDAILDIWQARAVGVLEGRDLKVSLEFKGERRNTTEHTLPKSTLKHADFEIRFYYLKNRQSLGLKVGDAREYLQDFGGVHIYDTGFRLPYYGDPKNDWLRLNIDYARRLGTSELLPKEMRVPGGMEHLPRYDHLLGVVNVNTSREDSLTITITRDRLAEGDNFDALRNAVRFAIEWYAMEKVRRHLAETGRGLRAREPSKVVASVGDVVRQYEREIPQPVLRRLEKAVEKALDTTRKAEEQTTRRTALLGALASAGIATIAFQHELRKQISGVEEIVEGIKQIASQDPKNREALLERARQLENWVARTQVIGSIFGHLMDADNINQVESFRVDKVVSEAVRQIQAVLVGIPIKENVPPSLRFPKAAYAEWVAILQNVLINASNAMADSRDPRIRIEAEKVGGKALLRVMDNGIGVDLRDADVLFEPFERRLEISPERKSLALGGTGMGLAIVRMIAERRGCTVQFGKPPHGFATSFEMTWGVGQ